MPEMQEFLLGSAKKVGLGAADSEVFWINKICGLAIVILRRFLVASRQLRRAIVEGLVGGCFALVRAGAFHVPLMLPRQRCSSSADDPSNDR